MNILKSRTMLFSLLLAVLGVVQAGMGVFTPYLSAQGMGFATILIGVAVGVLRVLTTTPLDSQK